MTAGIYVIRNQVNEKEYLGQAADIEQRWDYHRWQLRKHRHGNQHLQRAWNKYGESAFRFQIVEAITDLALLNEHEHYHGDLRKPAYNIAHLGGARRARTGFMVSDATISRVRTALHEIAASGAAPVANDIAQQLGLSCGTIKKALQHISEWGATYRQAARRESLRRARSHLASAGYPNVRHFRQLGEITRSRVDGAFQAITAAGEMVSAAEIARRLGIPKGTAQYWLQRAPYWTPELIHAARSENGRQYKANLIRDSESIQASLVAARQALEASGYLPHKLAGLRRRGLPLSHTHPQVMQARQTEQAILEILREWQGVGDGSRYGAARLGQRLGISRTAVKKYLKRLRAEGQIDVHNRPL